MPFAKVSPQPGRGNAGFLNYVPLEPPTHGSKRNVKPWGRGRRKFPVFACLNLGGGRREKSYFYYYHRPCCLCFLYFFPCKGTELSLKVFGEFGKVQSGPPQLWRMFDFTHDLDTSCDAMQNVP